MARDPYLGMSLREKQKAKFKEFQARKAAERAKKIANAQEKQGGSNASVVKDGSVGVDNTIFRYPAKAIDNSSDCLRIQIFENIRGKDITGFGVPNVVTKDENGNPTGVDITQLAKIRGLNDIWNSLNSDGSDATGTDRLPADKKVRIADIFLPIPQQISDNIGAAYAASELNPAQAIGLNVTKEALDRASGDKKTNNQYLSELITGNLQGIDEATRTAIQNVFAASAVNAFGANVNPQSLISRATGQVFQQNLELLFSGVKLRTFPFIFDFAPRDEVEAGVVMDIIRVLKRSASPSRKGSSALFVSSPKLFQLQYLTGDREHPFLNSFKVCVLEDISVNYTASGTYATYSDGTPVHMRMQLTFKEINPIYAEDYDGGESFVGPYANPNEAMGAIGGVGY
ncbi:MAG: hypothetical protein CMD02_05980 [Flavobacteriales bacterium]|nr:hypothetical protein [Flavobacteriales bacterium]